MNPDGSILLYEGHGGLADVTRQATGSPLIHAALLCYPALWDINLKRIGFGLRARTRKLLPVGALLLPSARLKIQGLDCKLLAQKLEARDIRPKFYPFGMIQVQLFYHLKTWPGKTAPLWSCAEWIVQLVRDCGVELFPGEEARMHAPHDFLRAKNLLRLP